MDNAFISSQTLSQNRQPPYHLLMSQDEVVEVNNSIEIRISEPFRIDTRNDAYLFELTEPIGITDVALATLEKDVTFSNHCLETHKI